MTDLYAATNSCSLEPKCRRTAPLVIPTCPAIWSKVVGPYPSSAKTSAASWRIRCRVATPWAVSLPEREGSVDLLAACLPVTGPSQRRG